MITRKFLSFLFALITLFSYGQSKYEFVITRNNFKPFDKVSDINFI